MRPAAWDVRVNMLLVGLAGAGAGAATMYMADPQEGRRRRARLREMGGRAGHGLAAAAAMTSRDVEHRLRGVAARTLRLLIEEPEPIDDVLVDRVRARLGRLVSHPGAIAVTATQGIITVTGPIFEAEIEQVLKGIAAVRGVTAIDNRLQAHADAVHVSALQGPGPRKVPRAPGPWSRWTPTSRLLAAIAAVAIVAAATPHHRAAA